MKTKNCIVCGKPAMAWTGHIHTEIGEVTSGWCEEHIEENKSNRPISSKCTSINPNSCGGDYTISEIEVEKYLDD